MWIAKLQSKLKQGLDEKWFLLHHNFDVPLRVLLNSGEGTLLYIWVYWKQKINKKSYQDT